jgi:hypothetical protein
MLEKSAGGIKHTLYVDWIVANSIVEKLLTGKLPMHCQDEYLEYYPKWIESSKNNSFIGTKSFPNRYISLGVTQAIDDWTLYCSKNNRRLRVFRGEYPYSKEFAHDWCWIEDEPLKNNDAILINFPFSGNGNKHPQYDWLIDRCNHMNIPVFVDCAFFGACGDMEINLNQPCIDTVAFSLTKGLSANNYRSGIAFSKRSGKDTTLDVQTAWQNGIHLNVAIGLQLMQQFSPDTLVDTYKNKQLKICKEYNISPSSTIQLATGDSNWNEYSRDGVYNRINIRNYL